MTTGKVIVAVTGSIAAYKAAFLTRLFIKQGFEVRVLMTPAATEFISPLTFATLSRNQVFTDVVGEDEWNNHVELGMWADLMVVAPATANTLSKCVTGQSDNIVVATYLSARCPVFFAPAMDLDMWSHDSTRENIDQLTSRGNHIVPVGKGELASGLSGEGRMAEPEDILATCLEYLQHKDDFTGKKVLVTAGPTYEPLDPVRFLGNRSTGTMGIAIADVFRRRGAEVHLILGPTHLAPQSDADLTRVETAEQMFESAISEFPTCDIAIFAAAVADFRPASISPEKIKKEHAGADIALERTRDIALELSKVKRQDQITVGFALETIAEEQNARNKLVKKKFDLIVVNSLRDEGAGFGTGTNKVSFIFPNRDTAVFPVKPKLHVAENIADEISRLIND